MHSSRSTTAASLGRATARFLLGALLAALWAQPSSAVPTPGMPSLAAITRQAPAVLATKRPLVAVVQAEAKRPAKDKPWPPGCFTVTDNVLGLADALPEALLIAGAGSFTAPSRTANLPRAPPLTVET